MACFRAGAIITVTTLMWVTARYVQHGGHPYMFVFICTNIFSRATVPCLNVFAAKLPLGVLNFLCKAPITHSRIGSRMSYAS